MKRVGIGGMQNFDANLRTPQVVDQRLSFMTPEWKGAFRHAATLVDQLGLELAIAASPGWSETGGPWVQPKDGMKKLVWSETQLAGGKRFIGTLAAPPSVTGPYQSLPMSAGIADLLSGGKPAPPVTHYADITLLAYPAKAVDVNTPRVLSASGTVISGAELIDESFETAVEVPSGTPEQPGTLTLASFALGQVPTTVSITPVTARHFRLVLAAATAHAPNLDEGTPGTAMSSDMMALLSARATTVKIGQLRLSPEARVHQFETKAGLTLSRDYYALSNLGATTNVGDAPDRGVAPEQVINLSSHMKPDGTLDWTAPPGSWRVVRFGYLLVGTKNHPATPEATGLEVDKFDAAAVRNYLETYLAMYRDTVGADLLGKRGLRALAPGAHRCPHGFAPGKRRVSL